MRNLSRIALGPSSYRAEWRGRTTGEGVSRGSDDSRCFPFHGAGIRLGDSSAYTPINSRPRSLNAPSILSLQSTEICRFARVEEGV